LPCRQRHDHMIASEARIFMHVCDQYIVNLHFLKRYRDRLQNFGIVSKRPSRYLFTVLKRGV